MSGKFDEKTEVNGDERIGKTKDMMDLEPRLDREGRENSEHWEKQKESSGRRTEEASGRG